MGDLWRAPEERRRPDRFSFMERFADQTVGRKRPLVSGAPEDLYPGRPDLVAEMSLDLENGW